VGHPVRPPSDISCEGAEEVEWGGCSGDGAQGLSSAAQCHAESMKHCCLFCEQRRDHCDEIVVIVLSLAFGFKFPTRENLALASFLIAFLSTAIHLPRSAQLAHTNGAIDRQRASLHQRCTSDGPATCRRRCGAAAAGASANPPPPADRFPSRCCQVTRRWSTCSSSSRGRRPPAWHQEQSWCSGWAAAGLSGRPRRAASVLHPATSPWAGACDSSSTRSARAGCSLQPPCTPPPNSSRREAAGLELHAAHTRQHPPHPPPPAPCRHSVRHSQADVPACRQS
jgi:hypothetical protein